MNVWKEHDSSVRATSGTAPRDRAVVVYRAAQWRGAGVCALGAMCCVAAKADGGGTPAVERAALVAVRIDPHQLVAGAARYTLKAYRFPPRLSLPPDAPLHPPTTGTLLG